MIPKLFLIITQAKVKLVRLRLSFQGFLIKINYFKKTKQVGIVSGREHLCDLKTRMTRNLLATARYTDCSTPFL